MRNRIKRITSVATALLCGLWAQAQVAINYANFPDQNFRQYLSQVVDKNHDNTLSPEELQLEAMDIPNAKSLQGIEHFTHLKNLRLENFSGNALDLSRLSSLLELTLQSSYAETFKVPQQLEICTLNSCRKMYNLDLTNCTKLRKCNILEIRRMNSISIASSQFDSLQVTGWDYYKPFIDCLKIKSDGLKSFYQPNLTIKDFEITAPELEQFATYCEGSLKMNCAKLTRVDLSNRKCPSIDITAPALLYLNIKDCGYNSLVLDAPQLETLYASGVSFEKLDIKRFPNLKALNCSSSGVSFLDLSHLPNLKELSCWRCPLYALNLHPDAVLESFDKETAFYNIECTDGLVDLTTLPGFDIQRASHFSGAVRHGNKITIYRNKPTAYYTYATGAKSGLGKEIRLRMTPSETSHAAPFDLTDPFHINSRILYDIDGDGIKEFYSEIPGEYTDYIQGWNRWNSLGAFVFDHEVKWPLDHVDTYGYLYEHYNNDGYPDLLSGYVPYGWRPKIAISTSDSTFTIYDQAESVYPIDANNDGRIDLFSYNEHDWNILYQTADGSFVKTRIDTLSKASADSIILQRLERATEFDYSSVPSLRDGFMIGCGPVPFDKTFVFTQSIDVNRDGFTDLVGPRTIFYNMGDNRFVASPQPGEVTIKDLNNDGIPDFIYNDTENKRVYARIYLGDENFEEITMAQDLEVSDIHCYDFDKDGDVDVLLTFDYNDQFGFAFLVFAENQGKGKFAIHENAFKEPWMFGQCLDIDNDGKMELIGGKKIKSDYYCLLDNLYLFRLDTWTISQPVQEPLIAGDLQFETPHKEDGKFEDFPLIIEDIDNDGHVEIIYQNGNHNDRKSIELRYLLYTDIPLLSQTPANQAPERMAAPKMVADKNNGKLKLSWLPGKDKESSTVDLTYALRVGSAPGKDDIYLSCANPDGSRRDFRPGNMGANLDFTLNVQSWATGNYYIAIQAVDPMGKGSAWSEEVIYKHDRAVPDFRISDSELGVCDTLTVTAARQDAGFEYQWDWDGAEIIRAQADGSQYLVKFNTPGKKEIRLTVKHLADGSERSCTKQVLARRVSIKETDDETYAQLGYTRPVRFLDWNNDGLMDLVDKNGLYTSDEHGHYEKIGSIFNSNLTFGGYTHLMDFDMDGDVDFYNTYSNKGNLFINNGDHRFEGKQMESIAGDRIHDLFILPDLNNDGFYELGAWQSSKEIYKNTGDNILFEELKCNDYIEDGVPRGYDYQFTYCYDLDRDGYFDFIHPGYDNDTRVLRKDYYTIGGANFDFKSLEGEAYESLNKDVHYRDPAAYEDFNSDGYLDKVYYCPNNIKNALAICFGKSEYAFEEPRIYMLTNDRIGSRGSVDIVIYRIADFDNNGCMDLLISYQLWDKPGKSIILYMERDKSAHIEFAASEYIGYDYEKEDIYFYTDINHDGMPDIRGNYKTYLTQTHITNTAPEVPAQVRASQTGEGVLLQWEDAADRETPIMQMRYNVSVKKKGAEGKDAYIISPMNNESDLAIVHPTVPYQKATRKMIPIERFEAGQEYEVRVQAIDLWNAHSPFSEPFTIKITDKFIAGPEEAAPNKAITLIYNVADEVLQQVVWNWDGGVLESQEGTHFNVVWDKPGLKTITATVGTDVVKKTISVRNINLDFDFPKDGVARTMMTFQLPKDFVESRKEDMDVELSDPNVMVYIAPGETEAQVWFPKEGDYWLRLKLNDRVCGMLESETKNIHILQAIPQPQIRMVGTDEATGKNKITWDAEALPDYVTAISVYKEGGRYGEFESISRVEPAVGFMVDAASNPSVMANRYYIVADTEMGVESEPSRIHSSIHLMLNKGLNGAINLVWNRNEGGVAQTYRILRGTDAQQLEVLAEVSGAVTAYTDQSAVEGEVYFYALEFDAVVPYQNKSSRQLFANAATSGRSNVTCTDEAWAVTPAEKLDIWWQEKECALHPAQRTLHFRAEIMPVTADMKQVNWQLVEGAELATLSPNGVLKATGKEDGKIVVRATTIDGSGLSADVTVMKEGFVVLPETVVITVTEETTELTPQQNSLHLKASVAPAEVEQQVIWSLESGAELAEIDENGVLTALGEEDGTIVVRATSVADETVYGEITLTKVGFVTSIADTHDDSITLCRNDRELWITGLNETEKYTFHIFDLSGRMQQSETSMGTAVYHFSLNGLTDGVYFLQVASQSQPKMFRFLLK